DAKRSSVTLKKPLSRTALLMTRSPLSVSKSQRLGCRRVATEAGAPDVPAVTERTTWLKHARSRGTCKIIGSRNSVTKGVTLRFVGRTLRSALHLGREAPPPASAPRRGSSHASTHDRGRLRPPSDRLQRKSGDLLRGDHV